MTNEDRKLAVLYWKLQKQAHTHPKLRSYLKGLSTLLNQRHIPPGALNNVGLELDSKGLI